MFGKCHTLESKVTRLFLLRRPRRPRIFGTFRSPNGVRKRKGKIPYIMWDTALADACPLVPSQIHTYLSTHGVTLRGKDQAHADDTDADGRCAGPRKCPRKRAY